MPLSIAAHTALAPLRMRKPPLGAIRPGGWLRHQLELMVEGMHGHLEEISPHLGPDNGWFVDGKEGWEEQGYWLRGFYPLAVLSNDERCLASAHTWIEAVLAGQADDGWFGSSYHRRRKADDGREICDLWGHMVMLWPMRDHYEYTGDERILPFMEHFFAHCTRLSDEAFIQQVRGDGWQEYREDFGDWKVGVQMKRAGDMIPHLHWLHDITGDDALLELATRFYQAVLPPVGEFLDIHTVNYIQRYAYPALYGRQAALEQGLAETEYWYSQMMAVWGQQPRGNFAADEMIRPGKVDPRQGMETCTMVEQALKCYDLARLSGDPRYAERVEDVLYNHYPAAFTPDYRALHYVTPSNCPQLGGRTDHDLRNEEAARCNGRDYPMLSYSAHRYRCCQHNAVMGWPYLAQNLWQLADDGGPVAWHYGECELSLALDCGEIRLIEQTHYPFSGTVIITLAEGAGCFPLHLRRPSWSKSHSLRVNGRDYEAACRRQGLLTIERDWQAGDRVELVFAMETSFTRWPRNGALTVDRGPLSYSVRIEEQWSELPGKPGWPDWEVLPASPWNYGLVLEDGEPVVQSIEAHNADAQPWELNSAPIELRLRARQIPEWGFESGACSGSPQEVRKSPIRCDGADLSLRMIPLGCARLRMSVLPEVSDAPHAQRWKPYRDC